jgi:hypothetical protein
MRIKKYFIKTIFGKKLNEIIPAVAYLLIYLHLLCVLKRKKIALISQNVDEK